MFEALANKIFHRQEEILTLFEKVGLPKEFEKISNLFKLDASFTRSEEEIRTIEFLLWEWTAPIKQEIYPYLHILRKFLKEDVSSGLLESRFNLKKLIKDIFKVFVILLFSITTGSASTEEIVFGTLSEEVFESKFLEREDY